MLAMQNVDTVVWLSPFGSCCSSCGSTTTISTFCRRVANSFRNNFLYTLFTDRTTYVLIKIFNTKKKSSGTTTWGTLATAHDRNSFCETKNAFQMNVFSQLHRLTMCCLVVLLIAWGWGYFLGLQQLFHFSTTSSTDHAVVQQDETSQSSSPPGRSDFYSSLAILFVLEWVFLTLLSPVLGLVTSLVPVYAVNASLVFDGAFLSNERLFPYRYHANDQNDTASSNGAAALYVVVAQNALLALVFNFILRAALHLTLTKIHIVRRYLSVGAYHVIYQVLLFRPNRFETFWRQWDQILDRLVEEEEERLVVLAQINYSDFYNPENSCSASDRISPDAPAPQLLLTQNYKSVLLLCPYGIRAMLQGRRENLFSCATASRTKTNYLTFFPAVLVGTCLGFFSTTWMREDLQFDDTILDTPGWQLLNSTLSNLLLTTYFVIAPGYFFLSLVARVAVGGQSDLLTSTSSSSCVAGTPGAPHRRPLSTLYERLFLIPRSDCDSIDLDYELHEQKTLKLLENALLEKLMPVQYRTCLVLGSSCVAIGFWGLVLALLVSSFLFIVHPSAGGASSGCALLAAENEEDQEEQHLLSSGKMIFQPLFAVPIFLLCIGNILCAIFYRKKRLLTKNAVETRRHNMREGNIKRVSMTVSEEDIGRFGYPLIAEDSSSSSRTGLLSDKPRAGRDCITMESKSKTATSVLLAVGCTVGVKSGSIQGGGGSSSSGEQRRDYSPGTRGGRHTDQSTENTTPSSTE
ncbi:unnamed protein product, partial [Amoebophrya sp. A120]|eukprot:GSA120T00013627001.1